jgi:hypothetical protein
VWSKQLGAQEVAEDLGAGFAFAGFHELASEPVHCLFVAAFDFGDLVGVGGEDFIDHGFECAGVADLLAAFLFDDDLGVATGSHHFGKDFFALAAADFAGLDDGNQTSEGRRRQGAVVNGEGTGVQGAEKVVDDLVDCRKLLLRGRWNDELGMLNDECWP